MRHPPLQRRIESQLRIHLGMTPDQGRIVANLQSSVSTDLAEFANRLRSHAKAPLGRGVKAEVEQVGIAAELHLKAGVGRSPQIGRHHHRRAAEAGKGTGRHAARDIWATFTRAGDRGR